MGATKFNSGYQVYNVSYRTSCGQEGTAVVAINAEERGGSPLADLLTKYYKSRGMQPALPADGEISIADLVSTGFKTQRTGIIYMGLTVQLRKPG